jgi:CheY-like chemotaxis protein
VCSSPTTTPIAIDNYGSLGGLRRHCGHCGSGAELIEQLANEGPSILVITDISMPWMSGLQAMHAIRTAGSARR